MATEKWETIEPLLNWLSFQKDYVDIDIIKKEAIEHGLCKNNKDFSKMMTRFLYSHQNKQLPKYSGFTIYTELPFNRTSSNVRSPKGLKIGSIRVISPSRYEQETCRAIDYCLAMGGCEDQD
jgi:hypothetical protein